MHWTHDNVLKGYGRSRQRRLPAYTAEQVMQMHPDEMQIPHTFITQTERDLYENTPYGQSRILVAHLNTHDQTPRHRRPEEIQRRLKCKWKDAFRIHEAFEVIEADAKIVNQFIDKQIAQKLEKLEKGICYIEALAKELKAIEVPELKEVGRETVWNMQGEYNRVASCGAEALIAHAKEVAETLQGDWYSMMHGDPDPWLIEHYCKMGATEEIVDWEEQEKMEADHASLGRTELIGYHPLEGEESVEIPFFFNGPCGVYEDTDILKPVEKKDWLDNQPLPFRIFVKYVRKVKSYAELDEIAKHVREKRNAWEAFIAEARAEKLSTREIKALTAIIKGWVHPYNRIGQPNGAIRFRYHLSMEGLEKVLSFMHTHIPPMTKAQTSVFYTFRNIERKKHCMAPVKLHEVQPQGQKLLRRIFESKSMQQLRWLAAQMVKFQKHKIPGSRLIEPEWRKVWQAYHERMADFQPAQAA